MSARKLLQEIEKCFKQVDIGVEAFDSQYEKYEQSTNASQRDKLVDNIKKECKKLQRLRDQIKTWAAGNEVKDKGPLLEKRELIESKMEAFKAVEKEMKTKAFSKEGLSAASRLDPKEKEKGEMTEFLQDMVDALGRQIEAQEAETEMLMGSVKKSKKGSATNERVAELESKIERHKWHQEKLELLMRALANDGVDPEQVKGSEEDIRNYVENNQEVDFYEDEGIYDDFGLDEESENFNVPKEREGTPELEPPVDVQPPEPPTTIEPPKAKKPDPPTPSIATQARRPSVPTMQLKSPLPALATIQTVPPVTATIPAPTMKPAPPPTKAPGETLKYASAAAAAAANDAAGIGIAPLPPPPNKTPAPTTASPAPSLPAAVAASMKSSATSSPAVQPAQPVRAVVPSPAPPAEKAAIAAPSTVPTPAVSSTPRSPAQSSISRPSPAQSIAQLTQASTADESVSVGPPSGAALPRYDGIPRDHDSGFESENPSPEKLRAGLAMNGLDHRDDEDESIYHLPASLRELLEAYEGVKLDAASTPATSPSNLNAFNTSWTMRPDTSDAEKPRHYRPANPSVFTPKHYPQEPLPIFEDPRLYSKIDTDALFYSFYYRQGTYQQYLAAKALKGQSWRFHKNYQTWFQRHEEPKSITEDYEQGTYRFFDYESTWYVFIARSLSTTRVETIVMG
jgi:CCR4-NOT transcription complex subunit 3